MATTACARLSCSGSSFRLTNDLLQRHALRRPPPDPTRRGSNTRLRVWLLVLTQIALRRRADRGTHTEARSVLGDASTLCPSQRMQLAVKAPSEPRVNEQESSSALAARAAALWIETAWLLVVGLSQSMRLRSIGQSVGVGAVFAVIEMNERWPNRSYCRMAYGGQRGPLVRKKAPNRCDGRRQLVGGTNFEHP